MLYRVVKAESDQIFEAMKAKGLPVMYALYPGQPSACESSSVMSGCCCLLHEHMLVSLNLGVLAITLSKLCKLLQPRKF